MMQNIAGERAPANNRGKYEFVLPNQQKLGNDMFWRPEIIDNSMRENWG